MGIVDINKNINEKRLVDPVLFLGECKGDDIWDERHEKVEYASTEYRYCLIFLSKDGCDRIYSFINSQSDSTRFLLDKDFKHYYRSKCWYTKHQLIQYFESRSFDDGLNHSHFVHLKEWGEKSA